MDNKKRTLLKSAVLGITAIATSLTIGMSTACSASGGSSSDKEDDKTTTKIDEQTIKNGNFEFYSDNKGLYPISNPDNWSKGSNGNASASMSGVINTSKERWDYITNPDFAKTLEDNDDLESTDKNKKDYNGALTDDLPYKNTHAATDTSTSSTDESAAHAKDYIENPYTHKYRYDENGNVFDADGNQITTYTDADGNVFLDADYKVPFETSVLMIHNYRKSDYYGAETYYTSSTTVSLEANTAAEISLWVKTTEMYFGGSSKEDERENARIEFDRGAYIKVNTQVGGNSLDAFEIKNINTEQLNTEGENNGWVQYTIYVAASSFATTTVNLTLGLGENEAGLVEGYAFFDDVTIKKYNSVGVMEEKTGFDSYINKDGENPNVSYPLAPDAKNEFRVDVENYQTNDTEGDEIVVGQEYKNNSADRHFLIDFASSTTYENVLLNSQNVTAGLTVEDTNTGKYVCTKYDESNKYKTNDLGAISSDTAYIPNALKNNPINIKDDILATTTVESGENWKFDAITTDYSDILTDALKTATKLPGAGAGTKALVMLSARGAAYEAHIKDDDRFVLADDQYMLVSFWLKTSDMNGKTAATVTVKGLDDDKDVTSSFSVDTTTLSKVTIGEGEDKIEDAYNGWVRCFVRVSNTSKDTKNKKKFEIVVNFGNTSISNTTKQSYKAGWVALTNLSVMALDEDVYGYTSGSSQTASIEFAETVEKTSHLFDTELGEKNEIKTDLATPASYTGVNGNSQFVDRDTVINLDGYHDTNKNDYAGLLSKENIANYTDCMWYNALTLIEADNSSPDKLWNAVFGERTIQPLLIVNTVRTFRNNETKQDENKIYNYGYIGKSSTVSANSYKAVSVRVKASEGAIANIYLVEDKSGGDVLRYVTPEYNFRYDADGNILKGEPAEKETPAQHKENIAYTLRKDGLYENGDGKLYANFYNLTKQYDISFEHESFYDESGNAVKFEDLVKGETYYNKDGNAYAPHYLIAGGKDNNKVYLYSGEGVGDNATYFYIEDGKVNKNKVVHGVDKSIARYVNTEAPDTPYHFEIDTTSQEGEKYANKWVTVTFYIHSGAEAKNYKLELWSGKRNVESSYASNAPDSYVIFDYSDLGSSLDQSAFDGLVKGYTDDIIAKYKENITDELNDNDLNIADLEKKAGEGNKVGLYGYDAAYYTFSLYDSEAFIPFNGEINTDDTGYSFDYTESAESLAYLKVVDNGLGGDLDKDKNNSDAIYTMSAFIDYSAIDKDVDIIGEPTAPGTSDSGSSTSSSGNSSNVWLLASSIVLLAAMLIAIAALFIRDFVKKHKGRKSSSKNSYNFTKNKRYVKKYVKANGEAPVIEEGEVDESLLSDRPAEAEEVKAETPAEEAVEEPAAEPSPEETAEEPATAATDTPATDSETTETPAVEEKPEDDGKDE